MQQRSSRRGFSMVELLIICALIALLVSLLMPMLKKSREKAQQMGCLNNARQLVMAIDMYAQDHHGTFPPDTTPKPWSTVIASYAKPANFHCPITSFSSSSTAPEYGFNRFAFGQSTSAIINAAECPLIMDIAQPVTSQKASCAIESAEDIAPRHHGGVVIGYADGHAVLTPLSPSPGAAGDSLMSANVNLMAALPAVFVQKAPVKMIVPDYDPDDHHHEHSTIWPRNNGVFLGLMRGGYKVHGVQPNIVVDYQFDLHSDSQNGAMLIGVGYPNEQQIPRDSKGTPCCDSTDPKVPKPKGIQFSAFRIGAGTSSDMVSMYLNRGTGNWTPNANHSGISPTDYRQTFVNAHARCIVVGQKAVFSLYGAISNTVNSVGIDLAAHGKSWDQPDGQNGVWIHGYAPPNDHCSAEVRNLTIRVLPKWVTSPGDADAWDAF